MQALWEQFDQDLALDQPSAHTKQRKTHKLPLTRRSHRAH